MTESASNGRPEKTQVGAKRRAEPGGDFQVENIESAGRWERWEFGEGFAAEGGMDDRTNHEAVKLRQLPFQSLAVRNMRQALHIRGNAEVWFFSLSLDRIFESRCPDGGEVTILAFSSAGDRSSRPCWFWPIRTRVTLDAALPGEKSSKVREVSVWGGGFGRFPARAMV